jgi:ribosomal protein S12 methylthiotransferase accessory factor
MRRVPVTRVSDVTALDTIGLPVFTATTPLARDLLSSMGKGATPDAARLSAIMESIERVVAENAPAATTLNASYRDLVARGGDVVPLPGTLFELPSDTAYGDDVELTWIRGYDLLQDEDVYVPADIAINPPREGVLRQVDTNGLASGNLVLEAVLHAMCEVIERDCVSQLEFCQTFADAGDHQLPARQIRLETLPPEAREFTSRIAASGMELVVREISQDICVPTFVARLTDRAFPTLAGPPVRHFEGYGTHPNASVAVMRSITEALQSRLGYMVSTRESHNYGGNSRFRSAVAAHRVRDFGSSLALSFEDVPSVRNADLNSDLAFLLARLRRAGFSRCLVFDLTDARIGLSVVRVRIVGAAQYLVNRRRIGWRCRRHLL